MNQTAIIWPMIAHVVLVYCIYALIARRRYAAIEAGSAKPSQFRENVVEPPESQFVRNNLANQFELPVLFHSGCLALYVTGGAGLVAVVLAWLFVASRVVHAVIHVTTNRIRHRQPAFALGFLALGAMWLWLALHLLGLV
ncbi:MULTISPECIES: MAPEG family protein [Nitratireductor]|uniref:MAPEG family protein n=1 Tax=Nitratireductor TaxID=245876 RepID=UPI000D0DCF93|nr:MULTISPECIES: MAPEG family protein [Nitratireductor]PSM18498.1 hypothetical protein C7T96_11680 [Nitratireductor sp. StC3]